MFNTYIYGTPLGFDFYEDVTPLKEYFKGFYISSRKGRRLMVNRRDNGETFYNYLRYGLAEKGGRPNSFFGMSISMDNNEYAYDFKEIFDWFDYLFDKLVDRESLFFVNAGSVIQYKVAKFKDAAEEIQWLKNNIPNLFTKAQGLSIREYDSTFSVSTSGQIRCFNDETPSAQIHDVFKNCSWIALSPNFKVEEEPIEINPFDIESHLNKYTQQLVPIAISPKQENLSALHLIEKSCKDTIELIQKYLSSEHDETERNSCGLLIDKAKEIVNNANTIANKINVSASPSYPAGRKAPLRKCKKCGRELPVSNFVSAASSYCKDCETDIHRPGPRTRKCEICRKVKNITEFPGDSQICYECKRHRGIQDILKFFDTKLIAVLIVIALIVGISVYLIIRDDKSDNSTEHTEQINGEATAVNSDMVDDSRFNSYLNNHDYLHAFGELEGKDNVDTYLSSLKSSVEAYLWYLIDNPDKQQTGEYRISEFFIKNNKIAVALQLNEEVWKKYARAFDRLMSLAAKPSLSENQKREAYQLMGDIPNDHARETFKNRIDALPMDGEHTTSPQTSTPKGESDSPSPYIIVNGPNYNQKLTKNGGSEFSVGADVSLSSNYPLIIMSGGQKKKTNKKETVIHVETGKQVIVYAGNISFTITCKKSFTRA